MNTFKRLMTTATVIATLTATSAGLLAATTTHNQSAPTAGLSSAQRAATDAEIHRYLVNNPEIMMEMVQKLRARQAQKMQQAANTANSAIVKEHNGLINDPHAIEQGSKKAPITLVEFYDYQCSACAATYPELEKFLKTDFAKKNVRVVYRAFPFFGPASVYATKAVIAAESQNKSIALHNVIFKSGLIEGKLTTDAVDKMAKSIPGMNMEKLKKDMSSAWVDKEMKTNAHFVKATKLQATPALIFTPTDNKLATDKNTKFINSGMPEATIAANAEKTLKSVS